MKNLENADIAIQKNGRLTEGTLEWLNESAGTDFPIADNPFDRLRELTDSSTGITVIGYSNGDTMKAVACGQTDVAICGGDMYNELPNEDLLRQRLGFGACRLVLARTVGATDSPIQKIATSYPRLADAYRRSRDNKWATPETIIDEYKGGIEMIGRRNDYDAVIDVVDTGQTMATNGYYVAETIAEFETLLVYTRSPLETWSGGSFTTSKPEILEPAEFDAQRRLPMPLLAYAFMNPEFEEWVESGGMSH